jgi:hypothetical protein
MSRTAAGKGRPTASIECTVNGPDNVGGLGGVEEGEEIRARDNIGHHTSVVSF